MKVYIASFFADKDRVAQRAQELRDMGVIVTSRWPQENAKGNATVKDFDNDYFRITAVVDIDDIVAADTLILTVPTKEQMVNLTAHQLARGGRHVEFGVFYGLILSSWLKNEESKRELIIMGDRENVFHFLDGLGAACKYPAVTHKESWEKVVAYLYAKMMEEKGDGF